MLLAAYIVAGRISQVVLCGDHISEIQNYVSWCQLLNTSKMNSSPFAAAAIDVHQFVFQNIQHRARLQREYEATTPQAPFQPLTASIPAVELNTIASLCSQSLSFVTGPYFVFAAQIFASFANWTAVLESGLLARERAAAVFGMVNFHLFK